MEVPPTPPSQRPRWKRILWPKSNWGKAGVIILGLFLLGAISNAGKNPSALDASGLTSKPASDLVLRLSDVGEGWMGGAGSNETANQTDFRDGFGTSLSCVSSQALTCPQGSLMQTTAWVFNTTSAASSWYSHEKAASQNYGTSDCAAGDESTAWTWGAKSEDCAVRRGNVVWKVFLYYPDAANVELSIIAGKVVAKY